MRVLITGGNGSVGRDLVPALLQWGNDVVVLDRDLSGLLPVKHPRLELIQGVVEDRAAATRAIRGADAVVHLAWSFSEDPRALLEHDLLGHQLLLELSRAEKVKRFIYSSTAVVYGKPLPGTIDEGHPLRVLEARKPAYGVAKEFAEKLALLADRTGGPPSTILRFWWAFGKGIGGWHLRELLQTAASNQPLRVPSGCGGSFLSAEDLAHAIDLALSHPAAPGRIFNLSSAYVTWEEVATMVVEITGSKAGIELVPPGRWTGPPFLADAWRLDDHVAQDLLGYRPRREPEGVRAGLRRAIASTWEALRGVTGPRTEGSAGR